MFVIIPWIKNDSMDVYPHAKNNFIPPLILILDIMQILLFEVYTLVS